VRTALGASRAAVVGAAVKPIAIAMAGGVLAGVGLSVALARNLSPFLYGVTSSDWISFAAGSALLLSAGLLACAVPARRVAQTDPMQVLRQ
jgi:putative ABC transport system permease protein